MYLRSPASTARGVKVAQLKEQLAEYGDKFEVVDVPDIATTQFPEALVGVDALIHTASPLSGRQDASSTIKVSLCAVDAIFAYSQNLASLAECRTGNNEYCAASSTSGSQEDRCDQLDCGCSYRRRHLHR